MGEETPPLCQTVVDLVHELATPGPSPLALKPDVLQGFFIHVCELDEAMIPDIVRDLARVAYVTQKKAPRVSEALVDLALAIGRRHASRSGLVAHLAETTLEAGDRYRALTGSKEPSVPLMAEPRRRSADSICAADFTRGRMSGR
jgi:hypothetical protein